MQWSQNSLIFRLFIFIRNSVASVTIHFVKEYWEENERGLRPFPLPRLTWALKD